MRPGDAALISLGACAAAAMLEGVCAGRQVKSYFAKLRFPPYSAPLRLWYVIGGLYYAICFFVIYRVLRHEADGGLKCGALTLTSLMMAVNAFWNYVFFRARNLFGSFVIGSLYPVIAVALFACLTRFDGVAAWSVVPYLLYQIYALWWGYGLWKVNREAA